MSTPYSPPVAAPRPVVRTPAFVRRFRVVASDIARDRVALTGVLILAAVTLISVTAPIIAPYDPNEQDILSRLQPPFWMARGSVAHILGTDGLGRDLLSRIIYGIHSSLLVGICVVLFAGTVGTTIGMVSGYYGGRVDQVIMRIADIQTAFPGLLITLAILTMVGPNLKNVIIVLAINGWMVYARTARGQVLSLREQPFVESAVSVGCRTHTIVFSHILPNLSAALLTLATLEMARVILVEAILSFLGMGVEPPDTSLGLIMAEGRPYLTTAWWVTTAPGILISITVFAVNLISSWLRAVSDPVQRFQKGASGG